MNVNNTSCIPVEVRTALYRRVAAQAFINRCAVEDAPLPCSLDDLQLSMANELEAFHVREHGVENGIEIACAMLSDMVQPDFLAYAPRLTPFGEMVMAGLHDALINATPQPEAH